MEYPVSNRMGIAYTPGVRFKINAVFSSPDRPAAAKQHSYYRKQKKSSPLLCIFLQQVSFLLHFHSPSGVKCMVHVYLV
jgi:hypothetical protein